MADHNRSTLPSMATSTPASTPAPRPRRLSLFGPPIGVLEVFAKEMAFVYQAPFLALQAAVELGADLDEPTTAEPSATPAQQQPPAPPAAPAPERPKPAIGTGLDWQTARDRLIAIRRQGESFTSLRELAARVGCSEGLIRKAIKQDVGLRAWAAESKRTRRTAPAATGLERAIHRTPQRREEAPELATVEAEEADDTDVLLQRLIDAASPAERARLHAMPEEQRMSILRLMRDQDEDRDARRLRERSLSQAAHTHGCVRTRRTQAPDARSAERGPPPNVATCAVRVAKQAAELTHRPGWPTSFSEQQCDSRALQTRLTQPSRASPHAAQSSRQCTFLESMANPAQATKGRRQLRRRYDKPHDDRR